MSALAPIADIRRCRWDVRKVPLADIAAAPLILIAPIAVACGLPVLTHHIRVQSPRHGETGEKDISMVLVGDDLRRERVPDVLIARNESHRRCYGEVIEDLHAAFVRELRSSCGQVSYVIFQVTTELVIVKTHAEAIISSGV